MSQFKQDWDPSSRYRHDLTVDHKDADTIDVVAENLYLGETIHLMVIGAGFPFQAVRSMYDADWDGESWTAYHEYIPLMVGPEYE